MGVWQEPQTPASARRCGRIVLVWPAPSFSGGSGLACALLQRGVWLGLRPPSAGGLAWPAPSFSGGSGLACALLQRGVWLGLRPPSAGGLAWPAPSFSGGSGLACVLLQRGVCLACALLQRRVWLGLRRYPTCSALRRFQYRGTPPVPPAGAAPPAPRLRNERGVPREPASAPANVANPRGREYHKRSFFQGGLR